jgi:predicted ATP-grasp superfamily ATP-dependent carboligase
MSSKRIIVTGGRSPAALELSRLLSASGHTVFAAESWKRHLCRSSRSVSASFLLPPPKQNPADYAKELRSVIESCRADILIPTCEEIYTIARYRELLGECCVVFTEPLSILEQLHHKGSFIRLVEAFGLNAPITRVAESRGELLDLARDKELFPDGVVLKPVYSRFASKVVAIPPGSRNVEKYAGQVEQISEMYPWVVQSYLPGRQLCTYSVVHQGHIAAHTSYWTKYAAGRGASIHFEHVVERETFRFVETLVKALGFTGQIAFDFKEDREGRLLPLECNPRMTSGIHLLANTRGIDRVFVSQGTLSKECTLYPTSREPSMLGAAMLVSGWRGSRSLREWKEWAMDWARGRDVLFDWNDPMPAFEQLRVLGRLAMERLRTGVSLMELTTSDIEWNGET